MKRRPTIKKFKSPLETLLRLRKMKEDRIMGELSSIMVRVNSQELTRQQALKESREELIEFESHYDHKFNLNDFKLHNRYLDRLQGTQESAGENILKLKPELDDVRSRLTEAARNRKVVENLKERQRDRHIANVRKFEKKEMEEINQIRFKTRLQTGKEYKNDDQRHEFTDALNEYFEKQSESGAGAGAGVQTTEDDPTAQYLKKLGIPDPRKKSSD